ncbi:hypothetical protein CVT24_008762 [Panaeolus cyanescens]|uniref:Uncharacterized protein n=1 Tax=Panaeolus cyanescens TaxID=181874 RepID=A0A409YWX4_9AGAR|nr:hypothetical protein CVT24_008762 [Panaeolus cyanescens]
MSVENHNLNDMIMDIDLDLDLEYPHDHYMIPFNTLVLDQIPSKIKLCKTPVLRYIINTFYVMFINCPPLFKEDWKAYRRVLLSLNKVFVEIEDIVDVWDVDGVREWGELAHELFIQMFLFFPDEIEVPDLELFYILKKYIDDPIGVVIEGIELTPDPEALYKLEVEREMERQAGVEEARMLLIARRLSPERPRRRKESYSTGQSKDKHMSPPKVPSKLKYSLPREGDDEDWLIIKSDDSD